MIVRLKPQDFELVSGNDKTLNFTVLDQTDAIVDLTGATIAWSLSKTAKSKTRIIEYVSPTNVVITDATAGKFSVSILDSDTEALKGGFYYHEARVTSAAGLKTTVAIGKVEVLDNIIST